MPLSGRRGANVWRSGEVPSPSVPPSTLVTGIFTVVALAACSTPRALRAPVDQVSAEDLDGHQERVFASDKSEGRPSRTIVLAAGGSRPPPRPPPVPPRPPPGRIDPRHQENDHTRPGHVPGRRLAGPPDAPYWEPVLEIPWRGSLQGPKPTPPQRAPGEAVEPALPTPRPPQQRPSQPPPSPATQSPQRGSNGTRSVGPAARSGTTVERTAVLERVIRFEGALNMSRTVARQLAGQRSFIPSQSILDTIAFGVRAADPQGVAGQFMYRSAASFNGSRGTLGVLVHEPSGEIRHVLFQTGVAP